MKTLKQYIAETETVANTPVVGDSFAINILDECLIESYIVDLADDGVVIEGDERVLSLLEQYGYLAEEIKRYGAVGGNTGQGFSVLEDDISEAEYRGRDVKLGKPFLTPDGPKKRSVYVRNPKGNVVKVNFGDPNMTIKKSNPDRRRSFRARHNCDNPGPKWKARYWSCRAW